jgi:hypothetical protein
MTRVPRWNQMLALQAMRHRYGGGGVMHKPVADEFEAIAARLREIEQGKQAQREKPAEPETTADAPQFA